MNVQRLCFFRCVQAVKQFSVSPGSSSTHVYRSHGSSEMYETEVLRVKIHFLSMPQMAGGMMAAVHQRLLRSSLVKGTVAGALSYSSKSSP